MASTTLTHIEQVSGQGLEITVKCDLENFEVEEIISVYITAGCVVVDAWPMFNEISEMNVAIEKIVARVDWREIYAETVNQ